MSSSTTFSSETTTTTLFHRFYTRNSSSSSSFIRILGRPNFRGPPFLSVSPRSEISSDDSYKSSTISGLQHFQRYTEKKRGIVVIGLNIHTCPVKLVESLIILASDSLGAIKELCNLNLIEEAVVLSTSNRIEVYVVALSQFRAVQEVTQWMSKVSGFPVSEIWQHVFLLYNRDAIRHIFEVLAGLDSLVLGESQILAQLKHFLKIGQRISMSSNFVDLASTKPPKSSYSSTILLKEDVHTIPQLSSQVRSVDREKEFVSLLKKCKCMEELKQIHAKMLRLGFFDSFCVRSLLLTCVLSSWGDMCYGLLVFSQIIDLGTFEFNIMIRGYTKDNDFQRALELYIEMLERENLPDNFTYPFVFKACSGLGLMELGRQIHGQVLKLGFHEDLFVSNSMINMYGKCKNIEDSCVVFEQIELKSVASWSALIGAYASSGLWWNCLEILKNMMDGRIWRPEESILVNVISACTHLGALDLGRSIHGYYQRNLTGSNIILETSLLDMYIKCGSIEKALTLFNSMSKKNRLSYSVMISGLGMHGKGDEALLLFSKMLNTGIKPDDLVYLGVLSACRHAGFVQEGLDLFKKMELEDQIQPTIQHYGCILDLLVRASMFDKAFNLINKMPIEMRPNDVIWRSLLNGARLHSNLEVGEKAFKKLVEFGIDNSGDYIMMSNMYARAKKWIESANTRSKVSGLDQVPGSSLVKVNRRMYTFLSQDKSHRDWEEIYEMIDQIEWQLKFDGYKPDLSEIFHNIDDEEKKQRLKYHSQKLAIAFALLHTHDHMPIRIIRNVRMCRDTHTYTKFISVIYNREIVVRDRNRFHHFKHGICSCRDYW